MCVRESRENREKQNDEIQFICIYVHTYICIYIYIYYPEIRIFIFKSNTQFSYKHLHEYTNMCLHIG